MNKFITLMAVLRRKAHLPAVVLLALMSGLAAKADVVVNATTFPDANFRNFIRSQSYGRDGVLTDAEIAGVTSIVCPERSIASLKGIEYFTVLSILNCSKNQLTSLDVSKNTALVLLHCYYNQLTELDLSNNTILGKYNDYYNTQNLNYWSQNRTLTAESAVTPEGERYYYLRLDNNVNGDKTIVDRMTETNLGGVASKFNPSRVLEWTSGGTVSDGILLLTDVTEDPIANTASGTVKYKYNVNNPIDPNGDLGIFTLNWIAPLNEVPTPGPTTALDLNVKAIRLQLTQSQQLEVVTPDAGEITWTSDNPEAVEVDSTGRITALKNGIAIITATAANGSSTWCSVYSYLLGDLNEDDKVDISDLNTEVSIVLGN